MAQNPVLREGNFEHLNVFDSKQVMTLQGTINKTFLLLFICVVTAMFSWTNPQIFGSGWMSFSLIGAFVVGIITALKPAWSPVTALVYAALQGVLLGSVSATYNARTNGIVFNAVAITMLVFFVMLVIYRFQIIRVTRGFMIGVMSAMFAICLLYFGSWILSFFFGVNPTYLTSNSPLSIGISIVICIVAALNFLPDFAFIDQMTHRYNAPKYMEWFAGFGLLVTLIWLYIEVLDLLSKLNSRR